ncbi:MAG: hypothetical protein NC915_05495 [Candidatus Omnitrophica bacterium]|nr:hypothetical protein [Candidatus Omnitrophota bacterium]
MEKVKFLFIFLIIATMCFPDEVIDKFFNQLKDLKEKAQFLRIETIESKIYGELNFSENTFKNLKDPFYKIFQKELPQNLKINGYLKGKISPESEKFEFSHLYFYIFSNIDSIVFSQIKDDIEIFIPSLGVVMRDKKQNIRNFMKFQNTKDINIEIGPLPVNFFSAFFDYLIMKEQHIKEKIKFEKEGKLDNLKTFIYNYPSSEGILIIEIIDKFYTFNQVKFINDKDQTEFTLYYPIPEKEVKVSSFLPSSITLKGEKDKNKIFLNFSEINYNKLFSESDFKIKEMNFPEIITSIYMRILK